ncbi:MAG: S41 family peptidase [Actinobacteria bacterium]|nr:S41 family peptidase [Actinomycetota bacterium]
MRLRAALVVAVALVAVLAAGLWLGGHPSVLPGFARETFVSEPGALSAEGAEILEDNYWRKTGPIELGNASLQGMVRELRRRNHDRFTEYFSPEHLESFNQQIEGRFSGIGLSVSSVKQGLRVETVFPHSPAAEAGIAEGEVIVSVDGKSIAGESSTEATKRIKGPEGTEVTVGVFDPKTKKTRQLTMTRAEVSLPNVSHELETVQGVKLGYVRMLSFSEESSALLKRAVEKVESEGAEGILVDLRHNPGGLLEQAVLAASIFLPKGEVVVTTKSRTQGDSTHETVGGNLPAKPLVVLVDGGTASAAEILTAALADDGNATTVGETTYGKGVFQEEHSLANGGALKMTVGEYFTPDGENLAKTHGIHPDVRVPFNPHSKADNQKARALQVLRGKVGA